MVRACIGSSILLASGLVPRSANAGNTVHPRTPVQWPTAACIQTVDRSADPLFEFSYTIPAEDLNVTADELDDSRRHQFVAFCRHWERETGLPSYLSSRDLQRVIDAGLQPADPELDEVLEEDAAWPDACWVRITPDDARRPISFATASEPVVWDTTSVEAGVYRIAGYTWEPPLNIWSAAPWAVRVVDGPDDDIGPAVVIGPLPVGVPHDEPLSVELCIDAVMGSRVELSWALKEPNPRFDVLTSTEFDGTAVELALVPPEESWGESILLAVTIEDPTGARYTAHAPRELIVYAPLPSMPAGSTGSDAEDDLDTDTDDTTGAAEQADDPVTAEGCVTDPHGRASELAGLGLLALGGLLRRRSAETTRERRAKGRR